MDAFVRIVGSCVEEYSIAVPYMKLSFQLHDYRTEERRIECQKQFPTTCILLHMGVFEVY